MPALDVANKVHEAPWRILTTQFAPNTRLTEAIEQVGLDYEVAFSDLVIADSGKSVPDRRATVRVDNKDYLGIVGGRYNIVQNKDAFAFLADVVDSGDIVPLGGGYFHGGARPWIQCRLPEDIIIAGDAYVPFIFVANSHDGSLPVTVALSGVRVVCENTYAANCHAPRRFVVRHLDSAKMRITEARRVLDISFKYFEEYKLVVEPLAATAINEVVVRGVVDSVFRMPDPNKSTEEQREAVARKRAQVLAIYNGSPLVPRGTKYGLLQAFTAYYDHFKNGFKGDPRQRAERKTENILLGDGVEWKDNVVRILEAA